MMRSLFEVDVGYSANELEELHELQVAILKRTIAQLVRNRLFAHVKGNAHYLVIQVDGSHQVLVALRSLLCLRVNATNIVGLKVVEQLINGDEVHAGNLGDCVLLRDRNLANIQNVIVHDMQLFFVGFEQVTDFVIPQLLYAERMPLCKFFLNKNWKEVLVE